MANVTKKIDCSCGDVGGSGACSESRATRHAPRFTNDGFTLIEYIIVIAIVSIALVPIINMFLQGVVGTTTSDTGTTAPILAQEKIEELKDLSFAAVTGSSGTFASPYGDYSYSVAVGYVDGSFASSGTPTDYKKVDVTVTHTSGVSVTLTTVIADKT